jgi:hypothetical protein
MFEILYFNIPGKRYLFPTRCSKAAACYNLKKWMKFITTKAKSNAAVMTKTAGKAFAHFLKNFLSLILSQIQTPQFYQFSSVE